MQPQPAMKSYFRSNFNFDTKIDEDNFKEMDKIKNRIIIEFLGDLYIETNSDIVEMVAF